MKIKVIIAAIVTFWLVPTFSAAKDVVIIGNSKVVNSTLSEKDVIKIFLGKKIVWDDKVKIVTAFHKDPAVHNAFLKKYIHKNASIFAGVWKRRIFTGKVIAPKYLESDKEMIRYVSETIGAIGYVSAETDLDNVKAIRVK